MTPEEFTAARQALALSEEELAADFGLTPAVVRAWGDGSVRIPKRYAQDLAWRAALAEREAAFEASGLAECEWLRAHSATAPADADAFLRHVTVAEEHAATCPTCMARQRYEEEHFPPLPPMPTPGWLPFVSWIERVPAWGRPAAVGAAILALIVCLRLVFALPRLLQSPAQLGGLLLGIIAAAGAGAAGGFAYSLTRPALRRLGRPGDYLTGIVCVLAYMGALALVAPIAFGGPVIQGREDLPVFVGVSVFFGLVIGHTWFREPGTPAQSRTEEG